MSLRKIGLFAIVILAFAPARALAPEARPTKRGIPAFLPVQSKDIKDLGAGKLLVATRDLDDPNFAQTVVLLVHYDAESVVGLVINRRTDFPLSRVLQDLKPAKDRSDPVYLGGPVETGSVFALLQSPSKVEGAEHVADNVYLIATKPLFEKTISANPAPGVFRVYLGYGGWSQEQLQMEVELGAWFVFPADAKTVFDPHPETLWSRMVRKTELKLAKRKTTPLLEGECGARECDIIRAHSVGEAEDGVGHARISSGRLQL